MAKTAAARFAAQAALAETTPDLSAKVQKAIDGIKKPFAQFTKDFSALAVNREELAPKFMKAFGMWQAETGGTYVDFVRFLVPEVGRTRNEYRNHKAYQAADYLRRLVGNSQRRPQTQAERATAPATANDVVARLMASLMTIIPENQKIRVWEAMQAQMHWSQRQIERLQGTVEHIDPLVKVQGNIERLRLTFPTVEQEDIAKTA